MSLNQFTTDFAEFTRALLISLNTCLSATFWLEMRS